MFWRLQTAITEFEVEAQARLAEATPGEPREIGKHLEALRAQRARAGQRAFARHVAGRLPLHSVPDPPLPDPGDVPKDDEDDGNAPSVSERR
jgi:hypothetical protein